MAMYALAAAAAASLMGLASATPIPQGPPTSLPSAAPGPQGPPTGFPSGPFMSGPWYALNQLARFDNAEGLPLVAAAPINEYLDIYWNGMSLVETEPLTGNGLPGIAPNSPPNTAAFSALDVATLTQGTPAMTVNYADSTVDHFDLKSFYYACAAGTEASVVGVPLDCTITVTGYDKEEKQVAKQEFIFKADGLEQQMMKAELMPEFKGLYKAEFEVSDDVTTAALIDTVSYTVYSTGKIEN